MMNETIRLRLSFLTFCIIGLVSLVFSRLFYLQIYKYQDFKEKSAYQLKRIIMTAPRRGRIFDRNNTPLALMKPAYSIYAIPYQIKNTTNFASQVSRILGMDTYELKKKLAPKQPFVWIKRQVSEIKKQQLAQLNLKGLMFIKEEMRVYPNQSLASQILGFVGIDNQGLGGIEYKFDYLLRGIPGKIILEGDPVGRPIISGVKKVIKPTHNGGHVYLTIDQYIQYIAEKHLKAGIQDSKALSGQIIVMDVKNSEILAMAGYPSFNPNRWNFSPARFHKNSCITDIYEPGSIFKLITIAAALNEAIVKSNTILSVPARLKIADDVVKEAHKRRKGETDYRSVTEIIQKSLNVGSSIIAKKLGNERFYKYIQDFGFSRQTGIQLPAESAGLVRTPKFWREIDTAAISYGQGIGVTPLQLAAAVAAIANDGKYIAPRIIKYITDSKDITLKAKVPLTNQVVTKKVAQEVLTMMKLVVDEGTGWRAKIEGFGMTGKTGTAQKPGPGGIGYLDEKYIASFVGVFPYKDPKVLILAVVDSPEKSIWGSSIAAPIVHDIALDLIDYLNILPEKYISMRK